MNIGAGRRFTAMFGLRLPAIQIFRHPHPRRVSTDSLLAYYAARAHEYEKVYAKPERQNDLRELHRVVAAFFADRSVLEIACGTGYWTRKLAGRAKRVTACDLVPEVLAIAKSNQPVADAVEFRTADAFNLAAVSGEFDAAFAGFWWSHLLHHDTTRFLLGLHARLPAESRVLLVDNRYVEGSNWPVTRTDADGNTYQERTLDNGAKHEVLKNFTSPRELTATIGGAGGQNIVIREFDYYWLASYNVETPPAERTPAES